MGHAERTVPVSLVSGVGQISKIAPSLAALAPTAVDPEPKPVRTDPNPPAATDAASIQESLNLKPKPESDPPKTLTSIVADIVSGGPSLTAEPLSPASPPTQASSAPMQTAGGKNCQILETLKLSLQGSDAVRAALLQIPARSLSVAKAIVLWDGQWIDASSVGGSSTLASFEQAVIQIVHQAPPNCQVEVLQGVRFITLGDARDTTVLAFGSNTWRWTDVVATLSPKI